MTNHETANSGRPSQATKHDANSRHGFIIATILAAFEAYGAALCGHVAIDPAADAEIDHPASKPAVSVITVPCMETFAIAKSLSPCNSQGLPLRHCPIA